MSLSKDEVTSRANLVVGGRRRKGEIIIPSYSMLGVGGGQGTDPVKKAQRSVVI